jgi:hypothetical protein
MLMVSVEHDSALHILLQVLGGEGVEILAASKSGDD